MKKILGVSLLSVSLLVAGCGKEEEKAKETKVEEISPEEILFEEYDKGEFISPEDSGIVFQNLILKELNKKKSNEDKGEMLISYEIENKNKIDLKEFKINFTLWDDKGEIIKVNGEDSYESNIEYPLEKGEKKYYEFKIPFDEKMDINKVNKVDTELSSAYKFNVNKRKMSVENVKYEVGIYPKIIGDVKNNSEIIGEPIYKVTLIDFEDNVMAERYSYSGFVLKKGEGKEFEINNIFENVEIGKINKVKVEAYTYKEKK